MRTAVNRILAAGFLLFIFGMGLWTAKVMYIDKKAFSEFENRELAKDPALSLEGVRTGQYFKDTELHFTDHLGPRDLFVKAYTQLQMLSGRTFVNNIYIADDGFIIYKPTLYRQPKEIDTAAHNLDKLRRQFPDTEFYFQLAPYKQTALCFKFPAHVDCSNVMYNRDYFAARLQDIGFPHVDMLKLFQQNFSERELEKMYFKTDHHWNMQGGFYAYKYMMDNLAANSRVYKGSGVNPDDYKTVVEKPAGFFSGSWNRQVYDLVDASSERIPYVYAKQGSWERYTVYKGPIAEDTEKLTMAQFFGQAKLSARAGYGSVYQGDYPEINIVNPDAPNDLHLVILKDSYADATYPLYAEKFAKTTFLEPRSQVGKTLAQQIEEQHADIVMFLYNDINLHGPMYDFWKVD